VDLELTIKEIYYLIELICHKQSELISENKYGIDEYKSLEKLKVKLKNY
jgi:hypothetical protein